MATLVQTEKAESGVMGERERERDDRKLANPLSPEVHPRNIFKKNKD